MQNFLYCDGNSETGKGSVTTGYPEYCTAPNNSGGTGWWGANAVTGIAFHMKPGNAQPSGNGKTGTGYNGFAVEDEMTAEYNAAVKILQPNELGKPFLNGEGGYSGNSKGSAWIGDDNGQSADISQNADYQASFTARNLAIMWSSAFRTSSGTSSTAATS